MTARAAISSYLWLQGGLEQPFLEARQAAKLLACGSGPGSSGPVLQIAAHLEPRQATELLAYFCAPAPEPPQPE